MGVLGEIFPESARADFIDRKFTPGCIVHLFCEFTNPPKFKYLLVATGGEQPILFIINSKIPDYVKARKDLLECQVSLKVKEHDFLEHDSYLDCGQPITTFTRAQIRESLMADIKALSGLISASVIAEVRKKVSGSRTLSSLQKRTILEDIKTA
jgi:hypothetical protein